MTAMPRRLHKLSILVLAVTTLAAPDAAVQGSEALDRAALEAFYDATGGTVWTDDTNWKTTAPLGEWFGVTTDGDGQVTRLELPSNGLTGPVPASLADLISLGWLDLGFNELKGPIPVELGSLENLRALTLVGNELTGPIPSELGNLVNLSLLALNNNGLTGPVPAWLANLTSLGWLHLGLNDFTGPIPAELGGLENLRSLSLDWNGLTGPIPSELGRLVNLESLSLQFNRLTGPIPAELGNLENLHSLNLYFNALTGQIPSELGKLLNLRSLHLGNNGLTGSIPSELGNLTNLSVLTLYDNGLTGPVPAWLGDLTSLGELDLKGNELTGTIPAELGGLENLRSLHLGSNGLTGPIPNELGRLAGLESLRLDANQLTDPIPAELGGLENLRLLHLGSNGLTGPIPSELGKALNLQTLWFAGNRLTGPIPAELGKLVNLEQLSLGNNELTGPISSELGKLVNLEQLSLGNNGLTGPISSELGKLVNLEQLSLGANRLTGPVPGELATIANLEVLVLGVNPLTGPLPQDLSGLSRLTRLDIGRSGACAPHDAAFQAWLATIDFQGESCNRPPKAASAIPVQTLTESGPALGLPMEAHFSDPDEDPLTYAAVSSDGETVTTIVSGDVVWLAPERAGTAMVTVTASDPDGLSADQTLAVTTVASAGPQNDREALEVFYEATGGANWKERTNWKTSAPLGEWHGVTTDDDGRVTRLDLVDNGLTGPLPPALEKLGNLEYLRLSRNDLIGPLPAWLGTLISLRTLSLWRNVFTGPIPDSLKSLVNLQALNLSQNELTGPIPAWLGSLRNLQSLNLQVNELTGPIPAGLGSLRDLRSLQLSRNELTGPIPNALRRLANLESLALGANELTGPVPGWLGELTELRALMLDGTALTGPIPDELGNLVNLESLWLDYAWGVSGPLPAALRQTRLRSLYLFATQACAPAAWGDWIETIEFSGRRCDAEPGAPVDVAVVYTPAAREALGGVAAIEAEIDLLIALTNQAFATSGMGLRVVLAGRAEVDYVETRSAGRDLDRLSDPADGHMDEVHALRDRLGADLVSLMVADSSVCGVANLGGAFSVTIQGCAFTHELGHNFGLLHDRYASGGGTSTHPAYGYVNQRGFTADSTPSSRWRTIMAYPNQCWDSYSWCDGLPRFSNPLQDYKGNPLGIAYGDGGSGVTGPADATAVLNATGPIVAKWGDRVLRPNRPPTAVGNLPGRTLSWDAMLELDVSSAFVDPDGDRLTHAVSSSVPQVVSAAVSGARVMLWAMADGTAVIQVMATDTGGLSATQSFSVTVRVGVPPPFTDHPIVPGVTPVRAVHFTELRLRIDILRREAGLGPFPWTDPVLTAGATSARLVHLLELREALAAAYGAAGRVMPSWTDGASAGRSTPIRAAHMMELRAAVTALE